MSSQRHETDDGNSVPRAVIHKKILAAAETNPSASIEALAAHVDGASATLVERVLDEYGDPSLDDTDAEDTGASDDQTDAPTDGQTEDQATETMSEASSHDGATLDHDDLTEQQRDILAEIENDPHATQQDIADSFDVSQATVSTHLNAIDGFDWSQRQAFVSALPSGALPDRNGDAPDETAGESDPDTSSDDGPTTTASTNTTDSVAQTTDDTASPDPTTEPTQADTSNPSDSTAEHTEMTDRVTDLEDELEGLEERFTERTDALEQQLDDRLTALERGLADLQARSDNDGTATLLDDSELAAKVIHACIQADAIDESEELHVIERLTTTEPTPN